MLARHGCLLALLCGCATFRPSPDYSQFPPEEKWALVEGDSGNDIDALVQHFYGGADSSLQSIAQETAKVLARHPNSGRAHEVAAYLALLQGQPHLVWQHFMHALADKHHDAALVDLWELDQHNMTVSELNATIELLEHIGREHPSAEVRAAATHMRSRYLRVEGRLDEAQADISKLNFLHDWMVAGSFDNDQGKGFAMSYAPETSIDLAAEMPGKLRPVRWRHLDELDFDGSLDLSERLWPSEHAVAYLLTHVHVDAATAAQLRLGSAIPLRAWVNGQEVASEEHLGNSASFDNVVISLSLEPGWNRILIKSANKASGNWSLAARITDEHGQPLASLQQASRLPDGAPLVASKSGVVRTSEARPLDEPRLAFLAERDLTRRGQRQAALEAARRLLERRPQNLPARYVAALAFWNHDQVEKTFDLLDSTLRTESTLPGFLYKRAELYRQKELYDQSEHDLRKALELQPDDRNALMALAELMGKRSWQTDRRRILESVLTRWPDSVWAINDLADCQRALGHLDRAEQSLRDAHALLPGGTRALWELERLAKDRLDYDEALSWLDQIATIESDSGRLWRERADVQRRAGKSELAKRSLEQAIKLDPDSAMAYANLGSLLDELDQHDEAVSQYEAALERNPENANLAERLEHLRPSTPDLINRYVVSDDEIENAIRSASKVERNIGSQYVGLLYQTATLVNADGSSKSVETSVQQVTSVEGRDELVQTHLKSGTKVKILKAYAIDPEGQRVQASSVTHTQVRFRNLEVGSIVVLQYVHHDAPERFLPNHYYGDYTFAGLHAQFERLEWVLALNKSRQLVEDVSPEVHEAVHDDGDWKVHVFRRDHTPVVLHESGMPPFEDLVPHVQVSTLASWDEFVRWELAVQQDSYQSDAKLESLANKLTEGDTTPRAKLDHLFRYAAEEIRYQMEYETSIAGVKPHACPVVLERKYGDCKDKAVLLTTLARQVGIELNVALVRTHEWGRLSQAVPSQQFNHEILYVPEQAGIEHAFFLDPTVDALDMDNLRSDDQGTTALVINPKTGEHRFVPIPYRGPEEEFERHTMEVKVVSPTDVTLLDHMQLRGGGAAYLRRAVRNEAQADKIFQTLGSYIVQASTLVYGSAPDHEEIGHPLHVDLQLDVSSSMRAEGDHFRLKVPQVFHLDSNVAATARSNPLELGVPSSGLLDWTATLPEGMQAIELPKAVHVESACLKVERSVEVKGRDVLVHDHYTRTCPVISVADYPAYRHAVQDATTQLEVELVFGAAPGNKAKAKPATSSNAGAHASR